VNIELKDFQEAALLDLFKKVERARRDAADNELGVLPKVLLTARSLV